MTGRKRDATISNPIGSTTKAQEIAMLSSTNPHIENYCISKSSLPVALCDELEVFTQNHVEMPQMLVGKLVASFLGFLLRTLKAQRVLEIGTYTGYSALAMANELPENGELITVDICPQTTEMAQKFWDRSEEGKKIKALTGKALEVLSDLSPSFDLIFIDADKENYLNYLKMALELLSSKGIIVLDNCLWGGKVLDHDHGDKATKGIKAVNDFTSHHPTLYSTLLPIRDGLLLVQKKQVSER